MAIIGAEQNAGPKVVLCGALQSGPALGGMTIMYILMSGFHAGLWLKILASRFCR